jgi:hypothetical protein
MYRMQHYGSRRAFAYWGQWLALAIVILMFVLYVSALRI